MTEKKMRELARHTTEKRRVEGKRKHIQGLPILILRRQRGRLKHTAYVLLGKKVGAGGCGRTHARARAGLHSSKMEMVKQAQL